MDLGGKLGGYSWPTCSKQLLFVDCRIVYSASEAVVKVVMCSRGGLSL